MTLVLCNLCVSCGEIHGHGGPLGFYYQRCPLVPHDPQVQRNPSVHVYQSIQFTSGWSSTSAIDVTSARARQPIMRQPESAKDQKKRIHNHKNLEIKYI